MIQSKIIKICAVVALVTVLLALGIGYAAVSKDLKANAEVDGNTQDKVFITDFALKGDPTRATPEGTSYLGSLLSSNVNVGKGESKTYNVTVYNSADEAYYYVDTLYDTTLGYDNTNVSFKLSIAEGDWIDCADQETFKGATSIVLPRGSLTFEITFTHNGSDATSVLNSVLNFMFKPVGEIQIASLIYDGQTYRDQFLRTETVAKFPEVPIDNAYNMARCNNDTTPVLENGYIKITGIDWKSKNQDNSVKCKIYKTLTGSMRDQYFENSNYTINNFIAFKSFEDKGETVEVPENKKWNIYLNGQTVTYRQSATYADEDAEINPDFIDTYKMMYFGNKSNVEIIAEDGKIDCGTPSVTGKRYASLAKLANSNATLTLNGGTYTCCTDGDVVYIAKGGKVICENITMNNWGNIFRTGLEPSAEVKQLNGKTNVPGSAETIHLEVIDSSMKSSAANVVHNTSRQIVLCSFVRSTLYAGGANIILANNEGIEESSPGDAIAAWENNRYYLTGCHLTSGKEQFSTRGARIYYTVKTYNSGSTRITPTVHVTTAVDALGAQNLCVMNYLESTERDWYYVKDESGKRLKDSTGKDVKVGDPVKIWSSKNSTLVWDINGGLSNATVGTDNATVLQVYESNNSSAQRWRFIAADETYGNYKYHIGNYDKPTVIAYSKFAGQTNGERVDLQSLLKVHQYEASRFSIAATSDGYYIHYNYILQQSGVITSREARRVEIYGTIQNNALLAVRANANADSNNDGVDDRHNRRSWTFTVSTANS